MSEIKISKADVPKTKTGEPDIAAILAANGLSHIDLSQVKVIKANNPADKSEIIKKASSNEEESSN
jgi:predicted metallopeptidase